MKRTAYPSRVGRHVAWAAALAALALPLLSAKPKDKRVDLFWTRPDIASYPLRQVALLPAVTFDRSLPAAKMVERGWGMSMSKSGHRWLSADFAKERLRGAAGGSDSLMDVIQEQVRKNARVDSSSAPELCRLLHTRAVLSLRIDAYEKNEVEPTQKGRASTFVWIKAALVDSSGALLWTASGSQRDEGADYDPAGAVVGMRASDLAARPVTGASVAAPSYESVVTKLISRFAPNFPPPASEPASADSSSGGH